MAKAQREAQELYQAGEKKWGTDESKFNQIIAVRSFPQLRATFDAYIQVCVVSSLTLTFPDVKCRVLGHNYLSVIKVIPSELTEVFL